jgi:1-acyl-sn-glycerol-3-phosphate acyltransferase
MSWVYYAGRIFTRIALVCFTRWQVKGRENVPAEGPLLIVANHINLADPPVIAVSIRRKIIFMAKHELFKGITGYVIRGFGAFPVNRQKVDRQALKSAAEVLEKGWALVMFPEGGRSMDLKLRPALPGSALVALRQKTAILPVGITGTEHIRGLGWIFKRPAVTVNIGKPFRLPGQDGEIDRELLTQSSKLITEQIAALLPEGYK